jgi:transposase
MQSKQIGRYADIVSFKKESGLLKGKARVAHIANKKIKYLLYICALNVIKCDQELKADYLRKTQTEGKPKIAILNAVRNKLI